MLLVCLRDPRPRLALPGHEGFGAGRAGLGVEAGGGAVVRGGAGDRDCLGVAGAVELGDVGDDLGPVPDAVDLVGDEGLGADDGGAHVDVRPAGDRAVVLVRAGQAGDNGGGAPAVGERCDAGQVHGLVPVPVPLDGDERLEPVGGVVVGAGRGAVAPRRAG